MDAFITVVLGVIIMTLLVSAMTVGLLRGIRIKGSCGGIAAFEADKGEPTACAVCGKVPSSIENITPCRDS